MHNHLHRIEENFTKINLTADINKNLTTKEKLNGRRRDIKTSNLQRRKTAKVKLTN